MKPLFFGVAAAMALSIAAFGQTAGGQTNSAGVNGPDKTDERLSPGGVIGIQPPGSSKGNTGPVSLATPTRPLVSGPNALPAASAPAPSTTATGSTPSGGHPNQ
jgi:hypothetical protein